jgi:hypothetical protein
MTIASLTALTLSAMTLIGKAEHVPPSPEIAQAIALAVLGDVEGRLTGSVEGDAVYMAREAFDESRWGWEWMGDGMVFVACKEGDGGHSFGFFQMQTRKEIGCGPVNDVARRWLAWAHASQTRCAALPLAEQLAELHSGTCARGRRLSAWRWGQSERVASLVRQE